MLNVKSLTALLSQNVDDKLCKRWWLMTPNGTLLAHSSGATNPLRRPMATVTLAWQEHDAARIARSGESEGGLDETERQQDEDNISGQLQDRLRTLTIEAETTNIIATRVQPQLLLVLEGGVPPRRPGFEVKITAEGLKDEQYPTDTEDILINDDKKDTVPSRPSSTRSVTATSILRLQRRKLEAMANAIADDLEQTGFQMPSGGSSKFF